MNRRSDRQAASPPLGTWLLGAMLGVGLLACERRDTPAAESATRADTSPGAVATPPADTATARTPPAATGTQTGAQLRLGQATPYGAILTDGNGRALYLLEEDETGASTCYEMCATIWPPFLTQGAPTVVGTGLRTNLIGTSERRGGGTQVTYSGKPLYYYLGDARPGDTRGQHVEDSWGEWYLVSPSGRHVEDVGDDRRRRRGGDGRDDG